MQGHRLFSTSAFLDMVRTPPPQALCTAAVQAHCPPALAIHILTRLSARLRGAQINFSPEQYASQLAEIQALGKDGGAPPVVSTGPRVGCKAAGRLAGCACLFQGHWMLQAAPGPWARAARAPLPNIGRLPTWLPSPVGAGMGMRPALPAASTPSLLSSSLR